MIEKTNYNTRPDGVELYQRKSTLKVKIRQLETGEAYDDPVDVEPCPYTYEETDIPIEEETGDLAVGNTLEMLNELGVDTDDQ